MAVEYDIYLGTTVEEDLIEGILKRNNLVFEKINTGRWVEYDLYDSYGFYITIVREYKKRFEIKNMPFLANELWSFRINKEFMEPIHCRKNILQIVKSLLEYPDINVLFISNGELLILIKTTETNLIINSNSGYFDNSVIDDLKSNTYEWGAFSQDDIELS